MTRPPVQITTTVSLRDAAAMFHHAMRVNWFSENITGGGTTFQKPGDSEVEQQPTDPPQLEIMAVLGGRTRTLDRSSICMYVWDRGHHRDIRLVPGAAIGPRRAAKKARRLLDALRAVDGDTSCTGL